MVSQHKPLAHVISTFRVRFAQALRLQWDSSRHADAFVHEVVQSNYAAPIRDREVSIELVCLLIIDQLEAEPFGPEWEQRHAEHTPEWRAFLKAVKPDFDAHVRHAVDKGLTEQYTRRIEEIRRDWAFRQAE